MSVADPCRRAEVGAFEMHRFDSCNFRAMFKEATLKLVQFQPICSSHRFKQSVADPTKITENRAMNRWKKLLTAEDGHATTEYALMLALIIVVSLGTVATLGTRSWGTWDRIFVHIDGV